MHPSIENKIKTVSREAAKSAKQNRRHNRCPWHPGAAVLTLIIGLWILPAMADSLSDLPTSWQGRLLPVIDSDISGAEPLMRTAIQEARAEIAALLSESDAEAGKLATAYGRLGALMLLLEVETQADASFRNAATLDPSDLRWPYYAGYLAMMVGNGTKALGYLHTAASISPDYKPLQMRVGKVHLDLSDLGQARAAFETIADEPGLAAAANYYLGQIANLERRFDDAIVLLRKALDHNPEGVEAHYPLAQAYRALGQNTLAREHLSRFENRSPTFDDPLLDQLRAATKRAVPDFEKGIYAIDHGKYDEAAAFFAAGLEVEPDNVRARTSYARALYLSGDTAGASRELGRVLAADPDLVLANFLQAVLMQQAGDLDGATTHYRRTLELDPGHAGALFYLANLDLISGRYREAAEGYRAALRANPEIAPARLLELVASYRAGVAERQILEALDALIAKHPDDPLAGYALARLLALATDPSARNPQRALEIANYLAMQQPMPHHLRLQAISQAATGNFDQAAETQRQIIAMAGWMAPPEILAELEQALKAFEQQSLTIEPWPATDLLLGPPPFDPLAPFRDYPDAVPY